MGEVYRARDERLGREVAIKILPPDVAGDPERRRRFEREARAVAALNHPGVLALHDVGEVQGLCFMVTELLEGESLRDRLVRGPAPFDRVVEWGAAAAEGLAAAHDRGIVHRDVKPENLFLTRDGRLKVLDFGLARELAVAAIGSDERTLSSPTRAGVVLGTLGYLSPEQARSETVDARSDIFSLGCVLYEALSGRRAFAGNTSQDLIASVLRDDPPDLSALRPGAPIGLVAIVRRCLAKERSARFQSASDLAFALRSLPQASGVHPGGAAAKAHPAQRARLLTVGLAVAFGLAGLAAGYWLRPAAGSGARMVLTLTPGLAREASPAISPDGKFVVYLANESGRTDVWVKFVGGGPAVNVTAGSGLEIQSRAAVGGLQISPDGATIAVRAGQPGEPSTHWGVWLVPAPLGGPPRELVERAAGLRWSPDGQRIAFMRPDPALGDSIVVARRDGSGERVLVPPHPGFHAHEPAWSSDARWIYFDRGVMPDNAAPTEIWRVPSEGGSAEPVVRTRGVARSPEPTPDGRALLYAGDQGGGAFNVWWRALDSGRERRLTWGAGDYISPRLSRDGGRLVCEARTSVGSLRMLDLHAANQPLGRPLTGGGADDTAPSISRNGRIAFSSARNGTVDIWTSNGDGGNPRPLTSDAEIDSLPAISPDGNRVAFVSDRGGRRGLWLVSTGGGAPRELAPADIVNRPSWSPDGRRLVYAAEEADGRFALWLVPTDGGTPAAIPGASGRAPVWSPAGDLIAYFTSTADGLRVRFVGPNGERRPDRPDLPTGAMVSMAFSWDGRSLAMGISPGSGAAQILLVALASGDRKTVLQGGPFTALHGLAWTPDDRGLVFGLVQHESRVLLFDGLGRP
jgi:Tol biopolymer transport system component